MKEVGSISVYAEEIEPSVFQRVASVHPECANPALVHMHGPLDDPRMQRLLAALKEEGLKPWADRSRERLPQEEFFFAVGWEYDESDLEGAELLELRPPGAGDAKGNRNVEDGLLIVKSRIRSDITTIFLHETWYVAKDRVRSILTEVERVAEAEFLPTTEGSPWIRGRDTPYWELRSGLTLPRLSEATRLSDDKGRRTAPRPGVLLYRMDGYYTGTELHYRRSELEGLGEFHLAHTQEWLGGRNPTYRPLIASRRFYDLCRKHSIRTGWAPVRIDEE